MWLGFCSDEPVPSPKSHDQVAGLPFERSVNRTTNGAFPAWRSALKSATGARVVTMKSAFVVESWPFALDTLRVTVNFPGVVYWCTGFFSVDFAPSPKSHCHEVGAPVDLSMKFTFSGAPPCVLSAVKSARGMFRTVIYWFLVLLLVISGFDAVRVTSYTPVVR